MSKSPKKVTYIDYYHKGKGWKKCLLRCSCGWKGIASSAIESIGGVLNCPRCKDVTIGFIKLSTYEETVKYGTPEDRRSWWLTSEFMEDVAKTRLVSVDQLPTIDDDNIIVLYDLQDDNTTVLRHKDIVLWTELAVYNDYKRYMEIGDLLKKKYGSQLTDYMPTPAAEKRLYNPVKCPICIVRKYNQNLFD
jgi:hypothetical protein